MGSNWRSSSVGSCCYECKERFPACHDVCATYLKAKAEWQEKKDIINENRYKDKVFESYHHDRVKKVLREKDNKGAR